MRSLNIRLEGVVVPSSSSSDHEKVAFLKPISEFDPSAAQTLLKSEVVVRLLVQLRLRLLLRRASP